MYIFYLSFLIFYSGLQGLEIPPSLKPDGCHYANPGLLFEDSEILELRLEGAINSLMKDRADDADYHPMKLIYTFNDEEFNHNIQVRTRGNFRRQKANCKNPPLTINFEEYPQEASSIFAGQTKLKVVVPCQQEKHVVREYLVYKLYNLVSEYSFRVRLMRLTMYDTEKDDIHDPLYAFLIEDEDHMAARLNAKILKRDGLRPENMDTEEFHKMAVFAFMVGNTDWSIQYRHNIKLIYPESVGRIVSVPYDFDLVGTVDASYAHPAPELKMRSVKERRYRGYCLKSLEELEGTFDHFIGLKKQFYEIFSDCSLLDEGYIKSMHKYLDDFYEILDNPKKCEKSFLYPCDKNGTGNVVLTGMPKEK